MAYVSRDPFARSEIHRERVYVRLQESCDECGRTNETPSGTQFLFQYRTESDGGRKHPHRGLFCSRSCHDAYHR